MRLDRCMLMIGMYSRSQINQSDWTAVDKTDSNNKTEILLTMTLNSITLWLRIRIQNINILTVLLLMN